MTNMKMLAVICSVHGCGTVVGRCMEFVDMMHYMCTQHIVFEMGPLYFFYKCGGRHQVTLFPYQE